MREIVEGGEGRSEGEVAGGVLPQRIFTDSSLRSEASNSPNSDLYAREELLAPHVPHALVRQRLSFGLQHCQS